MSEDITFCSVECDVLECSRNSRNIKMDIPHSYADLSGDAQYCMKLSCPQSCPKSKRQSYKGASTESEVV